MQVAFTQKDELLEFCVFGKHAENRVKDLNRHQTPLVDHQHPHLRELPFFWISTLIFFCGHETP